MGLIKKEIARKIKATSIVGRTISLYEDFDLFLSNNHTVKCIEKCHSCCSDYFYISEWEFYTILFYIQNEYEPQYTFDKINYSKKQLNLIRSNYHDEYEHLNGLCFDSSIESTFRPKSNLHIVCPFLNDSGLCDIYPVRPMICREYGRIKHCYCDFLPQTKLIDINGFSDNNRIEKLYSPYGLRKPYPIIDWLGSMTEQILISDRFKKSFSVDNIKFYR